MILPEEIQAAVKLDEPLIRILALQALPGYLPGLTQPSLAATLQARSGGVGQSSLDGFDTLAAQQIEGYAAIELPAALAGQQVWSRLARGTLALLHAAGLALPAEAAVRAGKADAQRTVQLVLPALAGLHGATAVTLQAVTRLLNVLAAGQTPEDALMHLSTVRQKLEQTAQNGLNARNFLLAAQIEGIPCRPAARKVVQYGWGARARWLDISFTDSTSFLGTRIAQDKLQTAQVLRASGLPVPQHALAADAATAEKIAAELGYPVVVKPADRDGGRGVAAGLQDAEAVALAYERARAHSGRVLVEKHVDGKDYRLQVCHGEVYWVAHRIPASVTGDGTSTVRQMVERTNAERAALRPDSPKAGLKPIALDDEAFALLREQGLTEETVPAEGQWVRLRRVANVASGGVPVPALEDAHPDNLALAVRAARLLRLDVAGVDLLIPDIRTSWLESSAAICEVNAQPQLSPNLPAYLLSRLVEKHGRIPIVVVLGRPAEPVLAAWQQALTGGGCCLGLATAAGLWVGGAPVAGAMGSFRGGAALLGDPAVEVAMMLLDDDEYLRTGSPVDRIDMLILAGPLEAASALRNAYPEPLAHTLARMSARVTVNADCGGWVERSRRWPEEAAPAGVYAPEALAALLQELMAEDAA